MSNDYYSGSGPNPYYNGPQMPYQNSYGASPGTSMAYGVGPSQQNYAYTMGLGQALNGSNQLKALQDSGLLQQIQAMMGQGQGGMSNTEAIKNDPAYLSLLGKGQQSFNQFYSPIKGQVEGLYGDVIGAAKDLYGQANPSGMPVGSFENYYAAAANPIEANMAGMRRGMQDASRAGGNRSGMSSLASFAPGVAAAGELGTAGAMAAGQATQDEQQRAAANSSMKMGALQSWQGAAQGQAANLHNSLATYGAQSNAALQSALTAIMSMMGLDVQAGPQWNVQGGPGGVQWGVQGTGGY